MRLIFILLFYFISNVMEAQVSKTWVADNGDGTYTNPIIHADYSDPDVVRVNDDYYMVSSSFNHIPGLPLLHSKDLVNWRLAGYALDKQPPFDHFSKVQHGNGVWAPSIRYHNNEFYIYYPDPDFGIYLTKSKTINGPWSAPLLVEGGKGLIDPCPLWDNGKAYMVHAYAGSRAGIKSVIVLKEMSLDGTKIISKPMMIYDGHTTDPTIEGPKIYKRKDYYYIFAPAGGVPTGWQLILRSKSIYGPYERKVVLAQGSTSINGPHQGGWIDTPAGEDWFIHFQDKDAYGRILHLQPVRWINDWPVMGVDKDGDGTGEPVIVYKKPKTDKKYPVVSIPDSDEFDLPQLGLQWQWQANPKEGWAYTTGSNLRMYAVLEPDSLKNLWNAPGLLLQKFPAETFTAISKISFTPAQLNDRVGMIVFGIDYALISAIKKEDGIYVTYNTCLKSDRNGREASVTLLKLDKPVIYFRIKVAKGAVCTFGYSNDGVNFTDVEARFVAQPGKWVGAKIGFVCTGTMKTNDSGFAEIDWIRFTK